ncbi:MAG TPA: minor capsid protein [Pyrinomonadaceae bacterium]|nr:minor capsid protein [Pyrinomonadaceae bacterium]
MPTIFELAQSFRQRLLRREAKASADVLSAFESVLTNLNPKIEALQKELENNPNIELVRIFLLERYKALEAQTKVEIARFSGVAAQITGGAQRINSEFALSEASALIQSQTNAFVRLPTRAVESFVGLASDGSSLNKIFAAISGVAVKAVRDKLTVSIALGHNPRKLASEIRRSFGTPAARALTLSRNESLRSYREASRHIYLENSNLVSGYVRLSARNARTCPICWALDGEIYETSEPFASHVACRCSILPYMGKPLAKTGVQIFAALDADNQREILGNGKFELYRAGKISLNDLVETRNDKRWGKVRFEKSLRNL